MSGSYVDVPFILFESYMMSMNANQIEISKFIYEIVYKINVINAKTGERYPYDIFIYSGIDNRIDNRSNHSRGLGKDSIKIVLIHTNRTAIHTGEVGGLLAISSSEKFENCKHFIKYAKVHRTSANNDPNDVLERVKDKTREIYRFAIRKDNNCPTCKIGKLLERRRKKPYTGPKDLFLGCSQYPTCRHTQSLG